MKRFIVIVGLTVLSVSATALGCVTPDPCTGRYCDHYEIAGKSPAEARQPIGRDGVARVPYYVNPTGSLYVNEAHLIGAAQAAARTWEAATPALDLIYRGTTTTAPQLDDDMFVVGFAATYGSSSAYNRPNTRPDIGLSPFRAYGWYPCDTRTSGSCGRVEAKRFVAGPEGAADGLAFDADLQDELTHLFGSALGLQELDRQGWYAGMTMTVRRDCPDGLVCRERSTLAAGDIRGIRALYPATACAPAAAHRPARYSSRYAVCGVRVIAP